MPSLYLEAGAIHGCALAQGQRMLAWFEDVGRHNAVDKLAGWMWRESVGCWASSARAAPIRLPASSTARKLGISDQSKRGRVGIRFCMAGLRGP